MDKFSDLTLLCERVNNRLLLSALDCNRLKQNKALDCPRFFYAIKFYAVNTFTFRFHNKQPLCNIIIGGKVAPLTSHKPRYESGAELWRGLVFTFLQDATVIELQLRMMLTYTIDKNKKRMSTFLVSSKTRKGSMAPILLHSWCNWHIFISFTHAWCCSCNMFRLVTWSPHSLERKGV